MRDAPGFSVESIVQGDRRVARQAKDDLCLVADQHLDHSLGAVHLFPPSKSHLVFAFMSVSFETQLYSVTTWDCQKEIGK